ncbi:MAG: sulfotransferase family protein, partial [Gemmatimonadales bacterium]
MSAIGPWPNFFIVGAMRGGTTALYEYLAQHPEVFLPRVKEPHFFSQARDRFSESVHEEASYLALFAGATRGAVGEASASYLWSVEAPRRIRARIPGARIIILLRDPVERAHSHYLWEVRNGTESRPFYQALTEDHASPAKEWGDAHLYVDLGLYCAQVERYLKLFGADQVLLLLSRHLEGDPAMALRSVCRFLGIDGRPAETFGSAERHNPYGAPRS